MKSWDETASVYRSAWTIYDGLGRALQVQGPAEGSGKLLLADTKYNAQGQVWYSGLPRTVTGGGGSLYEPNWSGIPHTTTSYDGAGRMTSTQFADGSKQSVVYNGLKAAFYDPNNHKRAQETDWLGRLVKVQEFNDNFSLYAETTYTYDVRDQLTQVTDNAGNVTTITYDTLGRKTGMTDPDMGTWKYGYDFFGNLVKQTDARNTTLNFNYDVLNRLTRKWQGSTFLASFTYDTGTNGIGRRTQMVYGGDTACWEYNKLGQVTKETRRFGSTSCSSGGTAYVTMGGYDAFGRVITQTIPSGETLTFNYNAMGALNSLSGASTYVTNIDYNDKGAVESTYLNNGVVAQNCYDLNTARLIQVRAYPATSPNATSCTNTAPANPRLNLSFGYDPVSNIKQITDVTRSEVTNYLYDSLDRLTSVGATQNGATLFQRSYDYDELGNILRVGAWPNAFTGTATASGTFGGGSVGTNNRGHFIGFASASGSISSFIRGALSPAQQDWRYTNYTYGDTAHKHAVTGLSTGESYSYDANGNMTTRVEGGSTYTQNFDVENRLASVVVGTQTTTFVYDGDGALVKKVKPDGTSTLYLGSYEVELSAGGAVTKKTTYYPAGGAMRVEVVGVSNDVFYMLSDHLGSASVLLKSDGTIEANGEQRYYPFGESRIASADLKTAHLFTGQLDTGLGIYHFGTRFYSPRLGRFISADTIVPDFANPQGLNRYSYVYNNPLKYVDPTGHDPWWKEQEDEISQNDDDASARFRKALEDQSDTCGAWGLPGTMCTNPLMALEPEFVFSMTGQYEVVGVGIWDLATQAKGKSDDENSGSGNGGKGGGGPPGGHEPDDDLFKRGDFRDDSSVAVFFDKKRQVTCPACGEKIDIRAESQVDHYPAYANRRDSMIASSEPVTRNQVLDVYNEPELRLLCQPCNSSHAWENSSTMDLPYADRLRVVVVPIKDLARIFR